MNNTAWPPNTCYGCRNKVNVKDKYAFAYCSERCWYEDGCGGGKPLLQMLIFDTLFRLGIYAG